MGPESGWWSRRKFLTATAAVGAASTLPNQESVAAPKIETIPSSLSPEIIDSHKKRAVESLRADIPTAKEADYLRQHAQNLFDESQMSIPGSEGSTELNDLVSKSGPQLKELSDKLGQDGFGLFAFSDISNAGELTQKLYVIRKHPDGKLEFVKSYLVSMADKGFGNAEGSLKTPLGLKPVLEAVRGCFGEVLSRLNEVNANAFFNRFHWRGRDRWFVKGFGNESDNRVDEVITDKYVLDAARGIYIHGTNRSGERDRQGIWRTLLGGRRRTDGCIRMSNTDIRDLDLSGYIKGPIGSGRNRSTGTPVMIHATPSAIAYVSDPRNQTTGRPPRSPLW